jgi:hypothetical protein
MDMKKEFVQVYGHCVEDGVAGEIARNGPATYVLEYDVRRVAVYRTFSHFFSDDCRSIFHTHLGRNEIQHFWKRFCYNLITHANMSCSCGKLMDGFHQCECDYSMMLPLVEIWTKTGKYFVAGADRYRFVDERK